MSKHVDKAAVVVGAEAIAVAMALAIQKRTKSTWAISSTGVAGNRLESAGELSNDGA